jgi:Fe2+ or Zn2+ uptake regulation protein
MPRPSPVRDAVRAAFAGDRHALSLDDLQSVLRERGVAADPSSVFRAVTRLEEDHLLRRVELADGHARWENPGEHHEHVRCDHCGAVAPVDVCLVEGLRTEVERSTGFQLTGHVVVLTGTCPDCRA